MVENEREAILRELIADLKDKQSRNDKEAEHQSRTRGAGVSYYYGYSAALASIRCKLQYMLALEAKEREKRLLPRSMGEIFLLASKWEEVNGVYPTHMVLSPKLLHMLQDAGVLAKELGDKLEVVAPGVTLGVLVHEDSDSMNIGFAYIKE